MTTEKKSQTEAERRIRVQACQDATDACLALQVKLIDYVQSETAKVLHTLHCQLVEQYDVRDANEGEQARPS